MTIQSTSPSAASTSPSATSPRGGLSTEPAPVAVAPLRDPVAPAEEKLPAIAAANAFADIPESEYPIEIHLEKAKEFYDRGGLLILDAREPEEFAEGHIRGALSAPTNERLSDLEWVDRTAKDTRPILVYCGGGECELSLELGFEINRAGHRRVLVFKEGYPAWKEAGYPVEESTP